jgi:hypothetical protein
MVAHLEGEMTPLRIPDRKRIMVYQGHGFLALDIADLAGFGGRNQSVHKQGDRSKSMFRVLRVLRGSQRLRVKHTAQDGRVAGRQPRTSPIDG